VELARSALTEELGRLVEHLAEQLTDAAGGRPKTFRDSSLENLLDFFGRFCRMTCASRRACASRSPGIWNIKTRMEPKVPRRTDGLFPGGYFPAGRQRKTATPFDGMVTGNETEAPGATKLRAVEFFSLSID
jgi:hypothetical protein